ncbi:MAG: THUMP domain-containing protein [Thermoplasmata archaeon]
MAPTILVRYGELALKSPPVRREFERTLGRNLLEPFRLRRISCRLRADHGHLYLECPEAAEGLRLARRVFGVTSVSEVVEVSSEKPEIARALLEMAEAPMKPGTRFAVRARRTGRHPFTSQELARELGAEVFARWPDRGLVVDLDDPEVELSVEVRGPKTYLYRDRCGGPGGLPLGVAGRVVALVDGARGALGAYLMMKRGCRCAIVVAGEGEILGRSVLSVFDPSVRIEPDSGSAAAAVRDLLGATHADGVVLPLTLEEFPSAREAWGDHVLFSPTVGLDDAEVAARWEGVRQLAA